MKIRGAESPKNVVAAAFVVGAVSFAIETWDGPDDYRLLPTRRYAQSPAYVERLTREAGLREVSRRLFWDKLDSEYREELEGIAKGVKAHGFSYDTDDILAYNAHIEITGYYLPSIQRKRLGAGALRLP